MRFVPALLLSLALLFLGWAPTARAVSCGPGEVMDPDDLVWSPFNAVQLWPVPPVTASGDSGRAIQFVADAATYTLGVQLIGADESQPTQAKDYVVSECPHSFTPVGNKASCTAIGAGSYAVMYLRFGFGTQSYYDCPLTHGATYYINFRDNNVTPRGSVSSQFVIYNRTDGGPIGPTTCTLTATPASIGAGDTSTLTANCSPAATSFVWTGGTCVGTTGASCTVVPLVTTTYSVAEINSDGTGVPTNVTVTVTPLPTCALTATTSIFVGNTPTTLTASCSPAATTYVWTGGTCAETTGASCTVMPSATTTYTVAGINRGGTAGPIASITVTVAPPPTCTLTATPPSIFAGDTSTLTASCTPTTTTYVWSANTGFGNTISTGTVSPTVTTTYAVAGINSAGTGAATSATVTVIALNWLPIIDHYYQSILGRTGDAGGVAYWGSEAGRLSGLGADPTEAFIAMAVAFYTSPEFTARGLSNEAFVDSLYGTFFSRATDAGGLSYWVGQIDLGLSREMVMVGFLFSSEFSSFMAQNVGSTPSRAEVYTVIDFYRGAFGRLPDSAGFKYWVNRFRTAQCTGNATGAVYDAVIAIASGFFESPEYGSSSPAKTNHNHIDNFYNAFMRRGADVAGYLFWVNQLDGGANFNTVRKTGFIDSPEFAGRVQQIVSQGCTTLMQ